ncbi:hypothetical protein VTN96DRAFT_634 [Rasamsonia emersonii]|uniref:Uncharacterized protein n=1 Tax=Rasamsonia emersonii (strain ATCC 16479 / CBS 393.64 / IMI 116815) TaxID=1408163 RepID=A0A0F4YQQ9_RASE3|nr:hypothetical protein T310_5554 [Rasamsonia emersonii CBS 393.64]KKA20435.1 hypothetical protein T310_5554 [Rasamsonia emersonii CBS 393.64]
MSTPAASPRQLRSNSTEAPPPSAQQLFNGIRHTILTATGYQEPIYENVDPSVGSEVAYSLDRDPEVERVRPSIHYSSVTRILRVHIMPTEIHECHTRWLTMEFNRMLVSNWLTLAESDALEISNGLTFESCLQEPYAASSKTPDWYCRVDTANLPRIVVESGWSERWPQLNQDSDLWMRGGAPEVQLVLIFHWRKLRGGRVRGDLQVWDRDALGNANLRQTEQIFPLPAGGAA